MNTEIPHDISRPKVAASVRVFNLTNYMGAIVVSLSEVGHYNPG